MERMGAELRGAIDRLGAENREDHDKLYAGMTDLRDRVSRLEGVTQSGPRRPLGRFGLTHVLRLALGTVPRC